MTGADRRAEGGERFIGNYRVTRLLSEGGMGVVYAAEHRLLGRPAAIKLLLDQYSRNPQIVQRFFTEARAATAIRHPGIVEIYDFGHQDDGSAYIAMELLDGEDLDTRVRRLGRLPVSQSIHMTMQIASALAAAHGHGVVHRDLKPANIFLVPDPQVVGGERIKLLDFGIAKVAASELDGTADAGARTQAGIVMGTPSYMAPEQCLGAALVDARADLYAVGCILFEMLCGRPPFAGATGMDIIAAHLRQPPPHPREVVPEIPAPLEALILLLLEKDPARRPQTASELEAALGVLLVHGAAAIMPGPGSAPAPARRGRGLLVALAVCAVVGAAVAAAWPAGSAQPAAAPVIVAPAPLPPPPPPVPLRFEAVGAAAPIDDPAPMARWTLRSTPPGAQVLHGDEVVGETPLVAVMPVDPARAETVRVHLYDHVDQDVELSGAAGGEREVALVPYVKVGFLSKPAGAVIHAPNGETIGVTPGEIGVPPGAEAVTFVLRKPGYRDHEARVVPDKSQKLRIVLERSKETP
jgi:tRNA A-37 threonylcarbamoyl transferase component Bud32